MEKFAQELNNLQPFIIFGMLMLLWVVESFIPYFEPTTYRKKIRLWNLGMVLISFVVNGVAGLYVNEVIMYTKAHHLGLLNWLHLPFVLSFILGMLFIDLWDYGFHLLQHKVPLFWRFHRVHHSDTELDASSSLRFHPFDILLQAFGWTFMFTLLGISGESFIVYFTFYVVLIFLQHANLKIPTWLDHYGSYVFSMPGWHKMHHAAQREITDSHYGDVFTFWDRIFKTGGPVDVEHIQFGIEYYREPKDSSIKNLLIMPFKPIYPNDHGQSGKKSEHGMHADHSIPA